MITREMVRRGYETGLITLADAPDGDEVVCRIGDCWFYFWNGDHGLSETKESFIRNFTKDEIIEAIWQGLETFHELWGQLRMEYEYYDAILRGELRMKQQKDCLSCACSLSADDESGEQYLVCSEHGYKRVPEDGYCDDYN